MNTNVFQNNDDSQLKVAIKEEQLTVAPNNRATLNVGVLNSGADEDYFDIAVKGVPPEWVTIHMPVVHLAAGEAKLITISIQPSLLPDKHVAQYPLEVRAISRSNPKRSAADRSTLTVAAYQSRGRIGVTLASVQYSASPGSIIEIPILLQNRGEEEDSFRLNVRGIPEAWVSTNSTVTTLEPNTSAEIQLSLQIPRSPQATAGRTPFALQVVSQLFPTQSVEVECILTIAVFSQYSASLEPGTLQAEQFGQVNVNNEGNITDTYSLSFQSPDNELIFEKAVQVTRPGPQGTQQAATAYVEIPQGERFQVRAGERGTYAFRSRPRSRPIVGNELTYPFTATVVSTGRESVDLPGQVNAAGLLPFWIVPVGAGAFLLLCILLLIPLWNIPTSARATETASFNMTQTALYSGTDSDGDGLPNDREVALGTDPLIPDTDGDQLSDREEVDVHQTNPLDNDTDDDGLQDGAEIQTHQTDPRNPDMDGDTVLDGAEIARATDPRNADSDGDGLRDNDEIRLETDPRNADSDGDGLRDGQENETCPRPRVPDSDGDGLIDGRDLDPCNASNPALTATAAAGAPTATPTATQTLVPTPTPTGLPTATPTPTLSVPSLQGILLFSSNRDGNSEIYALNLSNQASARLTNNPAQDAQPALAPDSVQVAYVGNEEGNNELYVIGVNGGVPLNLTGNLADDQQPTWSPDGNWLAFTTNRDGNQEIYVMRRDGSEIRNLTGNIANDFAPTWYSVGGSLGSQDWIAFTTTRDGNQEIYKVRPDGTGLTNLTQNPANDHSPAGFTGGALLAFVSDRTGNSEIFTMTDTGGSPTNITNNPAQDLDPAFNPGGTWIAFSSEREGSLDVYIVPTSGGPPYNLTRNPNQDRFPDW
jgi:TolB protein